MNLLEVLGTQVNFISDCRELQFDTPTLAKLLFGEGCFKSFLYLSSMLTEGQIHSMCLLPHSRAKITAAWTQLADWQGPLEVSTPSPCREQAQPWGQTRLLRALSWAGWKPFKEGTAPFPLACSHHPAILGGEKLSLISSLPGPVQFAAHQGLRRSAQGCP